MESERPIEKLLRAFAKKRREEAGAPLAMHPATRRLLQGEVARRFGQAARPRSRWQTVIRLWPRFAWGLGALAVLAVAAALWLPSVGRHQSQTTLAKNEALEKEVPPSQPPPPATVPAAAPEPTPSAGVPLAKSPAAPAAGAALSRNRTLAEADKDLAVASDETLMRDKFAAAPPTLSDSPKQLEEAKIAGSSPMASNLPAAPGIDARRYGMARGGIAASPAQGPATASVRTEPRPAAESQSQQSPVITDQLSLAANSTALTSRSSQSGAPSGTNGVGFQLFADAVRADQGVAQAQSFVQESSRAKAKASRLAKAGAEKPILDSFQVVQLGQELRVIDRDGSVYIGNFQAAGMSPSLGAPAAQRPIAGREMRAAQQKLEVASALPKEQTAANYFFRVIGTNQSLKQKVVFTGNLLPGTNGAVLPPAATPPSGSVGGAVMPQAASNLLPLPTSRISGKALIGDRQEIEIHATPAKP